jgi:hypothetical protein
VPETLTSVLSKVSEVKNSVNAALADEFYTFMKSNGTSESYQKNNLKAVINFAHWLHKRNPRSTFYDMDKKELILKYLDSKIKTIEDDPEQRWITTWNDYMSRIKFFYRWLHNVRAKSEKDQLAMSEWQTPIFVQIKKRKSKRASPYSATEIWELDEVLTIVKYESNQRNKASLMLLWDLDARNHEVTNIELRNIRLREQYAEGEIPEGKTGSGPILLTNSFPYVRDWLNLHPLKDYPKAKLICHTSNGKALKPDYLWTMLKQLKTRIQTLIKEGHIKDEKERARLEFLLKTKKWNPYCFRHSAITHDSDYLPGYALNKKVRWSMNSKQPGRYIKNRMGDTLKKTILNHNGIATEQDIKPKITSRTCPKCNTVNALENDYCSKKDCAYPLTPKAYDEIKKKENETKLILERMEAKMALYDKFIEDEKKKREVEETT